MSDIKGAMIQGTAIVRRDPASVLEISGRLRQHVGSQTPTSQPSQGQVGVHRAAIERRISWDYGTRFACLGQRSGSR